MNVKGRFRDGDLFCWLFNEVLRRCMDADLVVMWLGASQRRRSTCALATNVKRSKCDSAST
ncbi:hypothetical protein DOZ80_29030 [Pseudomonas fluorescens]|uniref:Uncharacterized protein n=1 Tax=Pseudomonas fluorescens TaxID=294 RepID=A0A327MMH6_PSEFL|nr:hypothetical protein DOZ80_29030 [Pseudomonas fluorescens]